MVVKVGKIRNMGFYIEQVAEDKVKVEIKDGHDTTIEYVKSFVEALELMETRAEEKNEIDRD